MSYLTNLPMKRRVVCGEDRERTIEEENMKLSKISIHNFKSFGEKETININEQTVLIGNNSSGKTTVLQALSKLFSDKQSERIIRKRDFHLPKDAKPGENRKSLCIETYFEFDELETGSYGSAIPIFFDHFIISDENEKPFLRIRLESFWEDDGTVEGSIDTQIYYVLSTEDSPKEEHMHHASRRELDKIRLLYVPASRNPEKELGNSSGSMLSRMVNSINWTEEEIDLIRNQIESLNNTFLSKNSALTNINDEIQKSWGLYHKDDRFSIAALTINSTEMSSALGQINLKFSPTTTEESFAVTDLGDGLRSIFYFSLVDSILNIESLITEDMAKNPDNPRFKLIPPVLTILAIEEPENHIAPHHIGKLIKRFNKLSQNNNAQVILTSHSPSMIKRINPENLRYLRIANINEQNQTRVLEIRLPQNNKEAYKYVKGAVQAYPELYFAKLVILGEGDSEELLLPKFFDLLDREVDSSQISVVPLGGRHVNYFWELLNSLRIPHITLLDLDNERYGGGWGRIKYVSQNLYEKNDEFKTWFDTIKIDLDDIGSRTFESIDSERLQNWFNELTKYNVFFSTPLDIDYLMLQHYQKYYLKTLSNGEGPSVLYTDENGNNRKKNLLTLDKSNGFESQGFEKLKNEALKATLKEKSGKGETFTDEERELMIWYKYFFLGRSKPTTHMQFLSNISDEELKKATPSVFTDIVNCAEKLLGEN